MTPVKFDSRSLDFCIDNQRVGDTQNIDNAAIAVSNVIANADPGNSAIVLPLHLYKQAKK